MVTTNLHENMMYLIMFQRESACLKESLTSKVTVSVVNCVRNLMPMNNTSMLFPQYTARHTNEILVWFPILQK